MAIIPCSLPQNSKLRVPLHVKWAIFEAMLGHYLEKNCIIKSLSVAKSHYIDSNANLHFSDTETIMV